MKTLIKLMISIICLIMIVNTDVYSQERSNNRELLIMLKSGVRNTDYSSRVGNIQESINDESIIAVLNGVKINYISPFNPEFSARDTVRILSGNRIYRSPNYENLIVVDVPVDININALLQTLNDHPMVEYAEKNTLLDWRSPDIYSPIPTIDIHYKQWNMDNSNPGEYDINALQAWTYSEGNTDPSFRVAIIDRDGID